MRRALACNMRLLLTLQRDHVISTGGAALTAGKLCSVSGVQPCWRHFHGSLQQQIFGGNRAQVRSLATEAVAGKKRKPAAKTRAVAKATEAVRNAKDFQQKGAAPAQPVISWTAAADSAKAELGKGAAAKQKTRPRTPRSIRLKKGHAAKANAKAAALAAPHPKRVPAAGVQKRPPAEQAEAAELAVSASSPAELSSRAEAAVEAGGAMGRTGGEPSEQLAVRPRQLREAEAPARESPAALAESAGGEYSAEVRAGARELAASGDAVAGRAAVSSAEVAAATPRPESVAQASAAQAEIAELSTAEPSTSAETGVAKGPLADEIAESSAAGSQEAAGLEALLERAAAEPSSSEDGMKSNLSAALGRALAERAGIPISVLGTQTSPTGSESPWDDAAVTGGTEGMEGGVYPARGAAKEGHYIGSRRRKRGDTKAAKLPAAAQGRALAALARVKERQQPEAATDAGRQDGDGAVAGDAAVADRLLERDAGAPLTKEQWEELFRSQGRAPRKPKPADEPAPRAKAPQLGRQNAPAHLPAPGPLAAVPDSDQAPSQEIKGRELAEAAAREALSQAAEAREGGAGPATPARRPFTASRVRAEEPLPGVDRQPLAERLSPRDRRLRRRDRRAEAAGGERALEESQSDSEAEGDWQDEEPDWGVQRRLAHAKDLSTVRTAAKPRLLEDSEHPIRSDNVSREAWVVLAALRAKGHEAYLVGGAVRDIYLKKKPKDIDILTSASAKQVREAVRGSYPIGGRFRIMQLKLHDIFIEISSFGTNSDQDIIPYDAAAHNTRKGLTKKDPTRLGALWANARALNALERDFTVNALLYDPFSRILYDYVGATKDLERGVLRTVIDPLESFREDPARILRGLRTAARSELRVDDRTGRAMRELAGLVGGISKGRLMLEANNLLIYGSAAPSLALMWRFEVLEYMLPRHAEYLSRLKYPRNPRKPRREVLFSILEAADKLASARDPLPQHLLFAALAVPLLLERVAGAAVALRPGGATDNDGAAGAVELTGKKGRALMEEVSKVVMGLAHFDKPAHHSAPVLLGKGVGSRVIMLLMDEVLADPEEFKASVELMQNGGAAELPNRPGNNRALRLHRSNSPDAVLRRMLAEAVPKEWSAFLRDRDLLLER